ncbi:hypothetical protein VPFG_00184 [Vibrio phage nt-1]|uniref:Uncharacterized protein n=1 Tax=Vibrio phage nt-1 TaxID=115992 RepID=R9TFE2_9CAUD|nr:hypothetical protein VPFG_00184 [Vibrio phage nt-1]AGN30184.1 hypothetical protein VPFG_00184 [Vibrio phage nt-1]
MKTFNEFLAEAQHMYELPPGYEVFGLVDVDGKEVELHSDDVMRDELTRVANARNVAIATGGVSSEEAGVLITKGGKEVDYFPHEDKASGPRFKNFVKRHFKV